MIRKILSAKNPLLREKAKGVEKIDKKVVSVITDLKDTLAIQKDPEGVGLAAPQIGKSLRIFVINYSNTQRVVINPEVVKVSEEKEKRKGKKKPARREIMEGCLSLPNYYSPLEREKKVTIKYLNEKGEEKIEKFKGFFAQIVLHEVDHLKGILFIDRLLEQKKPLYKLEKSGWEEVELI